jgi:hypothetical protein
LLELVADLSVQDLPGAVAGAEGLDEAALDLGGCDRGEFVGRAARGLEGMGDAPSASCMQCG